MHDDRRAADARSDDGVRDAAATSTGPDARPGGITRRTALKVLGAVPVLGAAAVAESQGVTPPHAHGASPRPRPPAPWKPRFFTAAELRTVRVLADDVIPRDDRSGSATDAGVPPEASESTRIAWRGGLRWLDREARRRHGARYVMLTEAQRHGILDDLAYADRVRPEHRAGAAFFTRFRDLCASGFWTSQIGVRDLGYLGGTAIAEWTGVPQAVLDRLGVSYALMDTRPTPK